ncbi:MAG: SDR family NAD(P)-dependent oxidoreductase [Pseudomonas sp.]|uniref:SDR family NAD(P)-dependent oxidoreductase n=1 Tax=Pseudomonas abieticivorans TaxID=2931382 RepID=UPI0020BFE5D9|nr:SDR family NAD(P)-dependent oxidoreductase [Pseudomonas sp. PIA16]MDE1164355.1 SDR family NAD(P)-dependent oxidoreductase [Pseudomonas sp.]
MQLAAKRIIVTGGGRGIGAAVVKAFVEQGARVVSLDLGESAPLQAPGGGWARSTVCDIADSGSVDTAFAWADQQLGGLDVLVHAAGIAPNAQAADISLEEWEQVFAVNTRGTFLTNRAAYERLKDSGGRIINFASAAGVLGQPGKAHYAASKGAVLAWTRTVAREWGPLGITVNAIAPAMWTPMYDATRASMSPEQLRQHDAFMAGQVPLGGRLGDAARDLAPVLVFLAGDGSRFVTGQTLAIDGGMLMLS